MLHYCTTLDRVPVFRHSAQSGYTAVPLVGAGPLVSLGITNTTRNITRAHMGKRPVDDDMKLLYARGHSLVKDRLLSG